MKKTIRHHFLLGLLIFTAFFSLVPNSVFAAGNSVKLTPPSGGSQPGKTFPISVDGFVGPTFFVGTYNVSGSITFPAHLLKVNSISISGATFSGSSTITPNNTNGTITFNQTAPWLVSANNQSVHLFTITFQSLANGTAPVNFSNVQYNTGAAAMSGGTYTISTPPPPPSPSPSPNPSPSTTPKPSSTPKPTTKPQTSPTPTPTPGITPTPEETPQPVTISDGGLKIENVKVLATRQENSISWTVNSAAATPLVTYGTSRGQLTSEATVIKQEDGSYQVSLADLKPGTLYYFAIKAATADNLQGATYSGTLTTRGYPVQLTIQQNNLLLPGAKVKIGDRSFIANKNAIITAELGDGNYVAAITPPDSTESHNVKFVVAKKTIPSSGNPVLQNFVLNVTTVGSSSGLNSSLLPAIIGGVVAVVAGLGGLIGFILLRRRKSADDNNAVDNDLLIANYGSAIDGRRTSSTPPPNLETVSSIAPPLASEQPYVEPPTQQPGTILPADDTTTTPPAQFDPAALPLPPTTDAPSASEPELGPQSEAGNSYSEIEQLSPELTQVESAGQITSDEPSATYDAATGELAIIHHHEANDAAETTPVDPTIPAAPPVDTTTPASPPTDNTPPPQPPLPQLPPLMAPR